MDTYSGRRFDSLRIIYDCRSSSPPKKWITTLPSRSKESPENSQFSGYIISPPRCNPEEDPTAMYELKSQRIIEDYVRLSLRPQLSPAEEKNLLEIYQKAELNHDLHLLLTVIDDWIFRECEHLSDAETKDLVNQEARIHEFLYTLENPGEPTQLAREILQLSEIGRAHV